VVLVLQLLLLVQTAVQVFMEWLWLAVVLVVKIHLLAVPLVAQQLQQVHLQPLLILAHLVQMERLLDMLQDNPRLVFHLVVVLEVQLQQVIKLALQPLKDLSAAVAVQQVQ
jgi:hypothetical protein